jgi:hypothetical protein
MDKSIVLVAFLALWAGSAAQAADCGAVPYALPGVSVKATIGSPATIVLKNDLTGVSLAVKSC